ncbi:MAG TPA: glycosyltransferase family 39 protein [Chthoniobacterales bacterium]|nr:glycosyltransferase family 39 protein [Chthoniobacterales bacterium]
MSRPGSIFLVIACWAAIYLPGLGSLEIKGEEGRRILPAVTMLDSGNYLVPQVGSEPYYRKPPLVNWLVAASFKLSGVRNEWAARLPSAISILMVALAFVTIAHRALGPNGSLFAALIWLANFGTIEKGRLIEIEALYVSLTGLALIFWLSSWRQNRSGWFTWTVPWIFLGLGILAKGPLHLLFFYAVVLAVLHRERELGKLLGVRHLAGLLIMTGIFAVWAIPYWRAMAGAGVAQSWSAQLTGRLTGDHFKLSSWLLNIPRGLAYFLPWTLLLPLVTRTKWPTRSESDLARALGWGAALPFLLVNLLPGGLPRYSMPALVPACWLMAMTLAAEEVKWRGKVFEAKARFRLILSTAITASVLLCVYALAVVPALQRRSKLRPIAAQIDSRVPDSNSLYALDPDYQPFLFYVKSRLVYVNRLDEVPTSARYLLVQPEREREVTESQRWSPLRAQPIERITDYRNHTIILARVGDG